MWVFFGFFLRKKRVRVTKLSNENFNGVCCSSGEEGGEIIHMGNAIMSFYSALIDLLGRCAPEMHVRFSMTTTTRPIFFIFVFNIIGKLKTQLDIISSSSSMLVKVKRSEFGPSCALWFLHLTSWASSASLQKCLWSIKVGQDDSFMLLIQAVDYSSTLAIF